tara:strand:+ start:1786 stop:1962 length:177 start_codon:yes stop_codon:yes gene_type:complete
MYIGTMNTTVFENKEAWFKKATIKFFPVGDLNGGFVATIVVLFAGIEGGVTVRKSCTV